MDRRRGRCWVLRVALHGPRFCDGSKEGGVALTLRVNVECLRDVHDLGPHDVGPRSCSQGSMVWRSPFMRLALFTCDGLK